MALEQRIERRRRPARTGRENPAMKWISCHFFQLCIVAYHQIDRAGDEIPVMLLESWRTEHRLDGSAGAYKAVYEDAALRYEYPFSAEIPISEVIEYTGAHISLRLP